jgi:hypothetical protein
MHSDAPLLRASRSSARLELEAANSACSDDDWNSEVGGTRQQVAKPI